MSETNQPSLTPQQLDEYYRRVRAQLLPGISSPLDNKPEVVTVTGLEGSGKTTMLNHVAQGNYKERGGAVGLEMDSIASLHPSLEAWLSDPTTRDQALFMGYRDAYSVQERLIRDIVGTRQARGLRFNMVLSNRLRNFQNTWYFELAQDMGFNHILRVLAVNPLTCRQRVCWRNEQQHQLLAASQPRRIVPLEILRTDNSQTEDVLRRIEELGLVNQILVLGEGTTFYDSTRDPDVSATQVLKEVNVLPWSPDRCYEHLEGWNRILGSMETRAASSKEIEAVLRLARADAFRLLPPEQGIRRFPELERAYDTLAARARRGVTKIESTAAATFFSAEREKMAKMIEVGGQKPLTRRAIGAIQKIGRQTAQEFKKAYGRSRP